MRTNPYKPTATNEKMEELANDRIEALGRANLEAEAAAKTSMRQEVDRLLADHRDRTAQLQEEMKVRLSLTLNHAQDDAMTDALRVNND